MAFEVTDQLRRHVGDLVGWLTTVTPSGRPAPRPVWFVFDGEAVTVFSPESAAKVRHIRANPNVTFHFNTDQAGDDVLVLVCNAEIPPPGLRPSSIPEYLSKYEPLYAGIGYDRESFDAAYSVALRLVPYRSWGF